MLPSEMNRPAAFSLDVIDVGLQHEIEQFLYREAALQDGRRYEEWLDLIAEDVRYFMPLRTNRSRREMEREFSGNHDSAYFDDDKATLVARVRKLRSSTGWSEDPPSRTRHLIGNVIIEAFEGGRSYLVSSAIMIYRGRLERQVDILTGERRDLLRRADNPYGFEIAARTFLIDQATLLANNISFFI